MISSSRFSFDSSNHFAIYFSNNFINQIYCANITLYKFSDRINKKMGKFNKNNN